MLPPRGPFQIERYKQTKSERDRQRHFIEVERKKAGGAVLTSDKIDFNTKATVRDKGHYIVIKGTIQQEDITIVNIYTLNIGAPKYVKQIVMDVKGEMNRNTVIVGDFNTPLTSMGRSSRPKVNKETAALNDI